MPSGNVEVTLDRLPHSADAERAVLGAILLDNACFYQTEALRPGDFCLDSHRRIFSRMVELIKQDSAIDYVTLCEILGRHHEVESVGGIAYVTSLTDGLPRVKNISQYVDIVRDKSMLRRLVNSCTASMGRIYDNAPAREIIGHAQDDLINLVNDAFPDRSLEDVAHDVINNLEELRRREEMCIGASSGLNEVDVLTTGYREAEVSVIGARPGNGKTAIAVQGIRRNLKRGKKVGFFSSEIPAEQIFLRLACLETGIKVFDTRDPRVLSKSDYEKLQEAVAFIATDWKEKLYIDDTPCMPIDHLLARARAWVSKGVKLIFVDYLQILDGTVAWKSEYDQVTNSMLSLWHLARSTKATVVALSQLKRTASNTRPTMTDLRSSGAIENFAQLIMLLWRELEYDETGEQIIGSTGNDEIIIAKQRSGPANITVRTRFEKEVGYWKYRE